MRPRRVLVALDASAPSLEAAATAAELARALGAQLAGLFVEDLDVIRLAALPFARQVPVPGGPERPLESEAVEAELRALAARAREALARAAAAAHVSWTFEIRRGTLPGEVLAAAGEADLLVLGARGHGGRGRAGATARAAAQRAAGPVLLHSPSARAGRGLLLAFDGSPGSRPVLAAGAALASFGTGLSVLCLAPDALAAERLAVRAREAIPQPLAARWAGGEELDDVLAAVRAAPPAILVVAAGTDALSGPGLLRLLEAAPCPVLVVRGG